jgi:hypothetical protein
MATRRKRLEPDVRLVFDQLSEDALLDDGQVAVIADVSRPTIKRWRRDKKGPRVTMLNGLPRNRVGDVRAWLREGRTWERGPLPRDANASDATLSSGRGQGER